MQLDLESNIALVPAASHHGSSRQTGGRQSHHAGSQAPPAGNAGGERRAAAGGNNPPGGGGQGSKDLRDTLNANREVRSFINSIRRDAEILDDIDGFPAFS